MSKPSNISTGHSSKVIAKTGYSRVEVIASPGSGKTFTLLKRLDHLVRIGVPASEILVLSFSNESVNELRRRMVGLGMLPSAAGIRSVFGDGSAQQRFDVKARPTDLSGVEIKTVHAFSLGVVKRRSLGLGKLSDENAPVLFKKAIRNTLKVREGNRETLKKLFENPEAQKRLMAAISYARSASVAVLKVLKSGRFGRLRHYEMVAERIDENYVLVKRRAKELDFSDMLSLAVEAIKLDPDVITYSHVLVDEYQDCSSAQVRLLAALVNSSGCKIMVFGDSFQSIYGFGGNRYTPLSKVVSGTRTLTLPETLRLSREVAALASAVAGHTEDQAIISQRDGPLPVLVSSTGLTAQTHAVVRKIRKLVADGTSLSQIAVLARTKALLAPVEQRLLAKGIQTARIGQKRDLQHPLRVLRLVSLVESYSHRDVAIDPEALLSILGRASPFDDVAGLLVKQVRALQKAARASSVEGRYQICADVYLRCLGGITKNEEIQHDLNRWTPMCRGMENAKAMRAAIKELDPQALVTATIHAAKGREWDHVFLVGVADGQVPQYLAKTPEKLAEERRLLYVAITRAKSTLRLYYAPTTHARSRRRFDELSRFLTPSSVKSLMQEK